MVSGVEISRHVKLPVPDHVRCEGDVGVDGDEVESDVQREPFGWPVLSPPVGDARCRAPTGTSLVTATGGPVPGGGRQR